MEVVRLNINTSGLSPKNDYLFKKLFTSKGNEDILCDFISAIIGREVVSAKVQMEKMLQREEEANKYGMLDIEVTLRDGSKIDVEMQRWDEVNHIKRTVYYAGKLISEQLQRGEAYDELKPVEIVYITDFNFLKGEHYKTSTVIVDELNRREVIINELRFHYIELPKFRKSNPDMREKLNQWLAFIDDQNKEWMNMAKDFNESISKAMDEFDRLVAKEAEKYTEAGKERFLMDMASVKYNTFNKGLNEGIQQGIQQGIEQGRQQGIQQGIEQGVKQGIKQGVEQGVEQGEQEAIKKHIVNMLRRNMDIDIISDITGASKEKILEIKEKLDKTI